MKRKLIPITLCLVTIIWIIFIFILSSQNGTQTAQTSEGIAKDVAEIIYQNPSQLQINQVHFSIRKLAHVGLFFVLGVLSFSVASAIFGWKKAKSKCASITVALVITLAYGFFDEWQKRFIAGRHFQIDEALLNIISGTVGILFSVFVIFVIKKLIDTKRNKEKI